MPVIEMYVSAGALDEEAGEILHERVSRRVMEAEGVSAESELGRAITWVLMHEMPQASWSVGGEILRPDSPRVLTRVAVPHGAVNDRKRAAIAAGVHEEVQAVLGEEFADVTKSFCVIEEHAFAGGSTLVDYEDLVRILNEDGAGDDRTQRPMGARA